MNNNWKQDPRLKGMSPDKLSILSEFAKKVETSPKDQLMSTLLTLNLEAGEKGIRFTDQETELLVSIMSSTMSPAEKKRIDTLRLISKNFAKKKQ